MENMSLSLSVPPPKQVTANLPPRKNIPSDIESPEKNPKGPLDFYVYTPYPGADEKWNRPCNIVSVWSTQHCIYIPEGDHKVLFLKSVRQIYKLFSSAKLLY